MAFNKSLLLSNSQNIGANVGLELCISYLQKCYNLLDDATNVVGVDKSKCQFESSALDGNVILLQAVKNGRPVSLHSTMVQINSLEKCVQGHIPTGQEQCNQQIKEGKRNKERKEEEKGRTEKRKRIMNEGDTCNGKDEKEGMKNAKKREGEKRGKEDGGRKNNGREKVM